MSARLTLLAVCCAMAAPLAARDASVGDAYLCEVGLGLPPVEVIVGRVEAAPETGDGAILHLSLGVWDDAEMPRMAHAPFGEDALATCTETPVRQDVATPPDFEDGYARWRTAFDAGEAGFFTVNPAEAYWTALAVIDESGRLKQ